jgi:hypothetical protein
MAQILIMGVGNPTKALIRAGTCIDWVDTTTGFVERWCNTGAPNLVLLAAQPDLQLYGRESRYIQPDFGGDIQ